MHKQRNCGKIFEDEIPNSQFPVDFTTGSCRLNSLCSTLQHDTIPNKRKAFFNIAKTEIFLYFSTTHTDIEFHNITILSCGYILPELGKIVSCPLLRFCFFCDCSRLPLYITIR